MHFRGRDPVSAYPLIRLRHDFIFTLATTSDIVSHTNGLDTLPEPSKFLELLLESLARLVILIRVFDHRLVSIQDLAKFQIIMQVEIYDLTSSERVKRGVKRAWLIGETLALETGSGQKQPNIHRPKYRGVRFRPSRSRTKPWTAEVKAPMEKKKFGSMIATLPRQLPTHMMLRPSTMAKATRLSILNTPLDSFRKPWNIHVKKRKNIQSKNKLDFSEGTHFFYFIHHLPYELIFCFVIWEFYPFEGEEQIRLASLVVQLMRLMRKDGVTASPNWDLDKEIAYLHATTNIPLLLESIDCLIKKIPQQKQGYDHLLKPYFEFLFKWLTSCLPPLEAQDPTKDIPLTFQFIEWVRII